MNVGSNRGWALLAALVSLALALAVLVPWQESSRSELHAAQRAFERSQCRWALDAALEGALLALDADTTLTFDGSSDRWLQVFEEPVDWGGVVLTGELNAADRLWDVNNASSPTEAGQRSPSECWRDLCALAAYPGGRLTAAALADWIDADNSGGSENSFYMALEPGYPAKNAPIDTKSELLLIRGFDAEALTKTAGEGSAGERPSLDEMITVIPRAHGTGITPLNLNLAPGDLVRAVTGLDNLRLADRIVRRRDAAPFRARREVESLMAPDFWERIEAYVDVRSSWFELRAEAMRGRSVLSVTALLHRPAGGRTVCRRCWWSG
jgi:type II secretory pathway component PulK